MESEVEREPLEELGGTIIYDSQAKLVGCKKIEQYFEETQKNPERQMDAYALFSKFQVEHFTKMGGFDERAKERDFTNEKDRLVHRHMPFMPQ